MVQRRLGVSPQFYPLRSLCRVSYASGVVDLRSLSKGADGKKRGGGANLQRVERRADAGHATVKNAVRKVPRRL